MNDDRSPIPPVSELTNDKLQFRPEFYNPRLASISKKSNQLQRTSCPYANIESNLQPITPGFGNSIFDRPQNTEKILKPLGREQNPTNHMNSDWIPKPKYFGDKSNNLKLEETIESAIEKDNSIEVDIKKDIQILKTEPKSQTKPTKPYAPKGLFNNQWFKKLVDMEKHISEVKLPAHNSLEMPNQGNHERSSGIYNIIVFPEGNKNTDQTINTKVEESKLVKELEKLNDKLADRNGFEDMQNQLKNLLALESHVSI